MAPGKTNTGRSLADQLADLEDPTPKDFDPEDLDREGNSSDEDAGNPSDAGREHYQEVGKGKLRKQDPISLGKRYAGARVSRDALDADSDDDPFAARSDDEGTDSDSDENEEADYGEMSVGSGKLMHPNHSAQTKAASRNQSKAPKMNVSEGVSSDQTDDSGNVDGSESTRSGSAGSEGDSDDIIGESDDDEEEWDDDSEDEDGDGQDEDSEADDDDGDENQRPQKRSRGASSERKPASDDREELRRLMASDQKTIASTISQAAKADAAKGKAVKTQRTTFDSLLNTRIKLQKGLSAINEISAGCEDASDESEATDAEAIKSAESAALNLWSTLEELRTALADAHAKDGSKKRKRPSPISPTTSTTSLWERMADLETESLAHRRSILDKWSSKVRGTPSTLPNARGKLLGSASGQQSITAVLDAHVATELGDRASKRARQNNASNGANSADAEPVYDDTVFYQSLLRDLVEQRMSSDAMTGGLDTLHQLPSRLPIHPVTGMRNDKVKRDVDTRASKGRKMRFNVHEKLQNFMAPEDRGAWSTRARDEFFASLLGRTASGLLGEGDESASDDESDNDREEGGLRLFRS